jgi:hypothetical protein
MDVVALAFAKLAAVRKVLGKWLENPRAINCDFGLVTEWYNQFSHQTEVLRREMPEMFGDLPERAAPTRGGTTDFEGRGYTTRPYLENLARDMDYIFEVLASSRISELSSRPREQRIFISHGQTDDWLEVQTHIEHDLKISTLELAQQPNRGRTVLQKLSEESDRCSYAVVVMTGDDLVAGDAPRARQNVMHEIGYFQGKFGLPNVCLLHEQGTDIPSNIHGLVYIPFPKGLVSAGFSTLDRELRATIGA